MQAIVRLGALAALMLGVGLAPASLSAQQNPYDPYYGQGGYSQYSYDPYATQGQYSQYPYDHYYGQGQYGQYPYDPYYGQGQYGQYNYNAYGQNYPNYGYNPYQPYTQSSYQPYTYNPYGQYPYNQYGQYGQYGQPYGQYNPYNPYGYNYNYNYGQYGQPGYAYTPSGYQYGQYPPYGGWQPAYGTLYQPYGQPPSYGAPPYGGAPYGGACYGGGTITVSATQSGNTAFISWTPYPGATNYNVLQGINGAPPTLIQSTPGTSYTAILNPGATYVFQIQAIVNGVPAVTSQQTGALSAQTYGYGGMSSGIVSPSASRIIANQQCVPMASGATLTVQVRDTNNMPLVGRAVWVYSVPPGAMVSPNQLTTDSSGNTPPFTVRAPYPGPIQFGATVDGVQIQPPVTITFQ